MESGRTGGEPTAHRILREIARAGRRITAAELAEVRRQAASAGFPPNALERAGGRAAGVTWQGRQVSASDRLPPAVVHYLRHVVKRPEWPAGTSLAGYISSIERVVLDPSCGVLLSTYQGELQVSFVGRAGILRGPDGQPWIVVEYRLATGHWVTAHQITLRDILSPKRVIIQWLRRPR